MGRFHEKLLLYVGIACASAALGLMPQIAYAGGSISNNCEGGGEGPDNCTCSGDCKFALGSIACSQHVLHIPFTELYKCLCLCV